jgi:hypothetical protein
MTSKTARYCIPVLFNRLIACHVGWFTFLILHHYLTPIFVLQDTVSFIRLEEGFFALFFICSLIPFYLLHMPKIQQLPFRAAFMLIPVLIVLGDWFKDYDGALSMNFIILISSFSTIRLSETIFIRLYKTAAPYSI